MMETESELRLSLTAAPDIATNPTDIVVTDKVTPCFRIISTAMPTKGTASLLDANTVQWKIDELGVSQSEGAVL